MRLTLADLCDAIVDCEHKTAPEGDGFALSIGTRAMKNGRLVVDACKPVSEATYDAWTRRMRPAPGDLVLAREAPVGQVIRVPDHRRICLGQRTVLIRPDRAKVHPRFLHYWLLGPDAQGPMTAHAGGATVAHLNVEDIRSLSVTKLPEDPRLQLFAASALGALDDLIEISYRRVQVLEEMARAIYREWFVHFRYPGHEDASLVDSPLGPIPYGWSVSPLFEVADIGFGFSFKSKRFAEEGPFPVIRIRDVLSGTTRTFTDEAPSERYRVVDGDVLIGMDGEFHLRQWSGGDAWLNQRVARLRPLKGLSARHLLFAVADPIKEWNEAIVGTTVAHLGKSHLEQIQIVLPPPRLLAKAAQVLSHAADQECALLKANRILASVRDLLLPRLVTGQIDVSALDLGALLEAGAA